MKIDQRVLTVNPDTPTTGWSENAGDRKFGVTGKVVSEHTGHGLCYGVQHDDGTKGFYEPQELEVI